MSCGKEAASSLTEVDACKQDGDECRGRPVKGWDLSVGGTNDRDEEIAKAFVEEFPIAIARSVQYDRLNFILVLAVALVYYCSAFEISE